MKDLEITEQGWGYSHTDLIESFQYEILVDQDLDRDYQGDMAYILKDGERYGYLDIGYGSCSGCDSLQACQTIEQYTELRNSYYQGIVWYDSKVQFLEWFNTIDWKGNYCGEGQSVQQFIRKVHEVLQKR